MLNKYRKIELWGATLITMLMLFALLYHSLTNSVYTLERIHGSLFRSNEMLFDYYIHYLFPRIARIVVIYLSFITLSQYIMPNLIWKGRYFLGLIYIFCVLITVFFVLMVCYSYLDGYLLGKYLTVQGAHTFFAKKAFLNTAFFALIYTFYVLVHMAYFHFFEDKIVNNPRLQRIVLEVAIGVFCWLAGTAILYNGAEYFLGGYLMVAGPFYIGTYFFMQYRILPAYYEKHRSKKRVARDLFFATVVMLIPTGFMLVATRVVRNGDTLAAVATLSVLLQLVVVVPVVWWVYYTTNANKTKVQVLEKALGRSSADLDFLRSQINPHFLFNALNTLYGTALQENAARTSEGIQRLGDMMRFMLHENHQEKIRLGKELAYLHNYISLQRLRVQESPDIQIEVNIDESYSDHLIAPMLLIPFVENAFKHGISLRSRSHISISLSCDSEKIYFDVHNTVHPRPDNDPERNSLGIGLNNVKQRLELTYPKKYELSIRQTASQFFIHLTIDVSK